MATKRALAKRISKPQLLAHLEGLTATELIDAVTVTALRRAIETGGAAEESTSPPPPPKKKPSAKPRPGSKKPKLQKKPAVGKKPRPNVKPGPQAAAPPALDATFDREKMTRDAKTGGRLEGFWAQAENPDEDEYKGVYPWPVPHSHPFKGETAFLAKLRAMQAIADKRSDAQFESGLTIHRYRGYASSRLEPGKHVGSATYRDLDDDISWPDSLLRYYIEHFHVRPSREFYDYVMAYRLPATDNGGGGGGGGGGEEEIGEEEKKASVGELERMARKPDGMRVEGYWASSPDPTQDEYGGAYPWPVAHSHPWKGEAAFLAKLRAIEAAAAAPKPPGFRKVMRGLHVESSRGQAPSRLEPEKTVGGRSYVDYDADLEWTEALGDYYVANFHVQPSREFIDYVMDYRL